MEATKESPVDAGSLSVEAILAALVDIAFRDGRAELSRAVGKRGLLRLNLTLLLGDNGRPLESTSSLVFEAKHHMNRLGSKTNG